MVGVNFEECNGDDNYDDGCGGNFLIIVIFIFIFSIIMYCYICLCVCVFRPKPQSLVFWHPCLPWL